MERFFLLDVIFEPEPVHTPGSGIPVQWIVLVVAVVVISALLIWRSKRKGR